ncbi:MAG TPA: hypothetical protein VN612_12720 [Acidobacteriaceae bacterium]|nr:hypothetical protein [Acidobacteriaceae bacterium]
MFLSGFERFLWAGGFVLECILLAVLFLKRRAASFPAFTFLNIFYVARTIVLFALAFRFGVSSWPYFLTYWPLAFVDELIQLVVAYELAVHVFCPTGKWARDVRRAFLWLIVASCVLALALSMVVAPVTVRHYQTFLYRSNLFTSALMSELFVGMMVLSATAGLPWKTHVARIAQGFGAYSIISFVLDAVQSYFGRSHGLRPYTLTSDAVKLASLGCIGYWIVTLWQEAPAPRELPDAMLMQIYTLQRRVESDLLHVRNWRRW